jgi:lysophospholipase L1-like esterase
MASTLTVVGMGDSVGYGIGDCGEDWQGPSWVGRFAHHARADRVIHLATPGQRAEDVLRVQLPAALVAQPSVVLMSLGGNDLLRANFDPASMWRAADETVARLIAIGAKVIVLGLPQATHHTFLPAAIRRAITERASLVNRALADVVSARKNADGPGTAHFIELWNDPRASQQDVWHIDRMHPSPRGHEYLAQAALAASNLTQRPISLPMTVDSSPSTKIWWLLRHGIPWLVRRSFDLIPQSAITMAMHSRHIARWSLDLDRAIATRIGRSHHGIADRPPSTTSSCPVMNEDASLARNKAA